MHLSALKENPTTLKSDQVAVIVCPLGTAAAPKLSSVKSVTRNFTVEIQMVNSNRSLFLLRLFSWFAFVNTVAVVVVLFQHITIFPNTNSIYKGRLVFHATLSHDFLNYVVFNKLQLTGFTQKIKPQYLLPRTKVYI